MWAGDSTEDQIQAWYTVNMWSLSLSYTSAKGTLTIFFFILLFNIGCHYVALAGL